MSKKNLITLIILILVAIGLCSYIFSSNLTQDNIKTLESFKECENGTYYTMDYYYDDIGAEFNQSRASNIFGYYLYLTKVNKLGLLIPNLNAFACSAFYTKDDEGHFLSCRNYDFFESNGSKPIILRTYPKNGYKSISLVDSIELCPDIKYMNLCNVNDRRSLLSTLYIPTDGINEKGVSISVLMVVGNNHSLEDTGKNKLFYSEPIRLVLDKASSTEEAIKLIKNYDYVADIGSFHFLITDSNNNSVVAGYYNGKLEFINSTKLTNHPITNQTGHYYNSIARFKYLNDTIKPENTYSKDEAMNFLKNVTMSVPNDTEIERLESQNNYSLADAVKLSNTDNKFITQWSVIYDNTDRSFIISFDEDYSKRYYFKL